MYHAITMSNSHFQESISPCLWTKKMQKKLLTFQEPKEVSCGRCLYEDKQKDAKVLNTKQWESYVLALIS